MAAKTAEKKTTKTSTKATTAKKAKAPKKVKAAASDVATPKRCCKVASCKREYRAKGYCRFHYKEWRQGKFGVARYKRCHDAADCRAPMAKNRHGFCETHFQNYYVKGMEVTHAAKPEAPKKEEKVAANAG